MKHYRTSTQSSGFTIVEILVVLAIITVIGLLTIVSYNLIRDGANETAASAGAAEAAKVLGKYALDNGLRYPATLADAGITNSGNKSYQYTVNNSTVPRFYCLTMTVSNRSFFVNSTDQTVPAAGGCPGHGQNGIPAIINYASDPGAEGTSTARFGHIGGTVAPATVTIATDRSYAGNSSLKRAITGTGQTAGVARPAAAFRLNVGETLSWSLWVYSTKAGTIAPYMEGTLVSNGAYTGRGGGAAQAVPANTWTRITGTTSPTADTNVSQIGAYNLSVVAGDVVWFDNFMVTKSTVQYEFADGDSSNWVWTGTPYNSNSTGPGVLYGS